MTEDDQAALEGMLQKMDGLVNRPDKWSAHNKDLHRFLVTRAQMPLVSRLFDTVLDHWDRLRLFYLEDVTASRVTTAQQEHWQIFEALRSRDPGQVAQTIHTHNETALTAYIAHLEAVGALAPMP